MANNKSEVVNNIDIKISGITLRRIGIWGASALIVIGGWLYPYRTEIKLFAIDDALDLKLTQIMPIIHSSDLMCWDSIITSKNKSIIYRLDISEYKIDRIITILESSPQFKEAAKRADNAEKERIFKRLK